MTSMCKVCKYPVYTHTKTEAIKCLNIIYGTNEETQNNPNEKLKNAMNGV